MNPALGDKRSKTVPLAALAVSGLAWWVLLTAGQTMTVFVCGVDGYGPSEGLWSLGRLAVLTGMWLIMALAMMLPVSVFTGLGRKGEISLPFLTGYLGMIGGISLVIAGCQWGLESLAAIGDSMRIANPLLSGLLLIAIGVWHTWPRRSERLRCASHFQSDSEGFLHGWRHGRSSFGCCLTMAGVQFVGGAMNIAVMIGMAIWILAKTVLPWKRELTASTGIALLTAGSLTVIAALGQ